MKIIVKNGSLEFHQSVLEKVTPTNVITSSYVQSSGASLGTASAVVWVNVYQVQAGKTYLIKGDDDWNVGTSSLIPVGVAFGTNHLTERGSISNSVLITTIEKTSPAINVQYIPEIDGYIYVTCSNESTSRKVSSVYEVQ